MTGGLQTLSLENVSKRYGTTQALQDFSLTIGRGEFLTLLGPSGSGKTTVLMTIAGFVAPTGGRILLDGNPIQHLPPEKRDFGMVFQGYALFPHLTVARNVAFALEVRGLPRSEIDRKVREALDLVQLGSLAERMPRQLSGGQQQRVALARALVFSPHLLLLDEPLSALDRKLRSDMQIELKAFHRRIGLTFVYVTHDQEEALSMSDRIAILREGRLLQVDTPKNLYERPATRFVASFLGRSNFLSGIVEQRQAGGFTFRCNGKTFSQSGNGVDVGKPVLMALRPERLRVLADAATAPNAVTGTIAEFSYLGTAFHLLIDTAEVGRLAVTVPTWRYGTPPAVGDKIAVGWDPDASIAIDDD